METVKIIALRIIAIVLALLWILGVVVAVNFGGGSNLFPIFFGSAHIGGPIVAFFLAEALGSEGFSWAIGAFFFPVIVLPILAFKKGLYYKTASYKTRPATSYTRQPSLGSIRTKEQCPFYQQGYCATPNTPTSQRLLCSLQYGSYDRDCAVYPINLSKK